MEEVVLTHTVRCNFRTKSRHFPEPKLPPKAYSTREVSDVLRKRKKNYYEIHAGQNALRVNSDITSLSHLKIKVTASVINKRSIARPQFRY